MPREEASIDLVTALQGWMEMLGQGLGSGPTSLSQELPWERLYEDFAQRYLWLPDTVKGGLSTTILPPELLFGTEMPELVWLSPLAFSQDPQELETRPRTRIVKEGLPLLEPPPPEEEPLPTPPVLVEDAPPDPKVQPDPLTGGRGRTHSLPLDLSRSPVKRGPAPLGKIEAPQVAPTVSLKPEDLDAPVRPELGMPLLTPPVMDEAPSPLSKKGMPPQKTPTPVRRLSLEPSPKQGDWTRTQTRLRSPSDPLMKPRGHHRRTRALTHLPLPGVEELGSTPLDEPFDVAKPTRPRSQEILTPPLLAKVGLSPEEPLREKTKVTLGHRGRSRSVGGRPRGQTLSPLPTGGWTTGIPYTAPTGGISRQRAGTFSHGPRPFGVVERDPPTLGSDLGGRGGRPHPTSPLLGGHRIRSKTEPGLRLSGTPAPTELTRIPQTGKGLGPSPMGVGIDPATFIGALAIASSTAFALGVAQTLARIKGPEGDLGDEPLPLALPVTVSPRQEPGPWTRSKRSSGTTRRRTSSSPVPYTKRQGLEVDEDERSLSEDGRSRLSRTLSTRDVRRRSSRTGGREAPEYGDLDRRSSRRLSEVDLDDAPLLKHRGSRSPRHDDLDELLDLEDLEDEAPKKKKAPSRGSLISTSGTVRYQTKEGKSLALVKGLDTTRIRGMGVLPTALPKLLDQLVEGSDSFGSQWGDRGNRTQVTMAKGLTPEQQAKVAKAYGLPLTIDPESGELAPKTRERSGQSRLVKPKKRDLDELGLMGSDLDVDEDEPLPLLDAPQDSDEAPEDPEAPLGRRSMDRGRSRSLSLSGDEDDEDPRVAPRRLSSLGSERRPSGRWSIGQIPDPSRQGVGRLRRGSRSKLGHHRSLALTQDELAGLLDEPSIERPRSLSVDEPLSDELAPLLGDGGPQRKSLGEIAPLPSPHVPWSGVSLPREWKRGAPIDPTIAAQWAVFFSMAMATQFARRSFTGSDPSDVDTLAPWQGGPLLTEDGRKTSTSGLDRRSSYTAPKSGRSSSSRSSYVQVAHDIDTPLGQKIFSAVHGMDGGPRDDDRRTRLNGKGALVLDSPEVTEAAMPLLSQGPLVVTGGGDGWTPPEVKKQIGKTEQGKGDLKVEGQSLKAVQTALKELWGDEDHLPPKTEKGAPKGKPEERDDAPPPEEEPRDKGAHLTGSLEEIAEELRWRMEISAAWEAERM